MNRPPSGLFALPADPSDDDLSTALPRSTATSTASPSDPLEITLPQRLASAVSGSLLTSLLVTPLDVVRVRLQAQQLWQPPPGADCCRPDVFGGTPRYGGAAACLALPRHEAGECALADQARRRSISSTLDGLRKIARHEGIATLWRGLSPTLLMVIPANVIYFSGYDWLRRDRRSPFSAAGPDLAPLLSGASARVMAALSVGPIELFRTRLQALPSSAAPAAASSFPWLSDPLRETFRSITALVRTNGYHSLWRGASLTLWRDVPFSAVYWWGYEAIRARLAAVRLAGPRYARPSDTFVDSFAAGALSGSLASLLTMPFDVGKTRKQVYKDNTGPGPVRPSLSSTVTPAASAAAPEQASMVRLLWHIFQTEGAAGLFRGWIPRTLKVAPACAIMISSYEVGKRVFRDVNEREPVR